MTLPHDAILVFSYACERIGVCRFGFDNTICHDDVLRRVQWGMFVTRLRTDSIGNRWGHRGVFQRPPPRTHINKTSTTLFLSSRFLDCALNRPRLRWYLLRFARRVSGGSRMCTCINHPVHLPICAIRKSIDKRTASLNRLDCRCCNRQIGCELGGPSDSSGDRVVHLLVRSSK